MKNLITMRSRSVYRRAPITTLLSLGLSSLGQLSLGQLSLGLLLSLAIAIPTAAPAWGAAATGFDAIALTVNNSVISYRDLENKIVFTLNVLDLEDNLENRDRIRPQAIQSLIDESLQDQETRRYSIKINEKQIDTALERIAGRNSTSIDRFKEYLAARNVPLETFREQLRTQLRWQNLIDSQWRPRIQISDEEIDIMLDFYKNNQGKNEYHIGEIYLPFDGFASRDQSYSQGQEIVALLDEISIDERRGTFQNLARQLSQSASALRGGDIGWVTVEQIDRKLRKSLKETVPGMISRLSEVDNGFYILFLHEKRVIGQTAPATVTLNKITLPVPATSSEADKLSMMIRAHIAGKSECTDDLPPSLRNVSVTSLGSLKIEDFPQHIQQSVHTLKKGGITDPIVESEDNAMMLQLCSKTLPIPSLPDRDQIANRIEMQRLQKMVEKQMRDLRRRAYIDLRDGKTLAGNDSG